MEAKPRHFLETITDSDWRLIAAALGRLRSRRARELSSQILAWRLQVAESEVRLLKAVANLR